MFGQFCFTRSTCLVSFSVFASFDETVIDLDLLFNLAYKVRSTLLLRLLLLLIDFD